MDQCQIDGIEEFKINHDTSHHEANIKSIKHINVKKNTAESDHRTPKRKSDISNSNTLKKKKKYETALAAIFPENDQSYSQYAQDYAEGYMKKMRERLDTESFDLAIKLLASFGDADDSNINLLYQQITELLTNKNDDLIYEFLGFLLPGQALSIGKLADYLELTRIKEFIRKLQVCMKKQPTQVRKILDNLSILSKSENITPLEVHTTMLPLLKSNPILVDCFFQLIPTEHPPESFFSDDNWEDLDIDQSINYGIDYEEIIPFDSDDHILLNACHCMCHKLGDITHCRSCGLKFFKGRVYFDTHEGLKLAKINFEGADPSIVQSKIDKTEVNVAVKKNNRKSLIKNCSPGSAEDIKGSTGTESEEDLIDVKPKKRQKSKVVRSLKLKFKNEESSKCKDDQETTNETGKSIVHFTNEELNSNEMVFFCIPKAESNVKVLPKKKVKVEVKENIMQKEQNIISQIYSEANLNNLNKLKTEKNNEIDSDKHLNLNNINISKELKTEIHSIPLAVVINNVPEIVGQCEQQQEPDIIQVELTSQALPNNDDIYKHSNSSINNMYQEHLETPNNYINRNEFILDSNSSNMNYKNQFDGLNTSSKLSNDCILSTTDMNKSLLDVNITIKNEAIVNSPDCYESIRKNNDNESEDQLTNKRTKDEDIIIPQTCKRVEDTPNYCINQNEFTLDSDSNDINKEQLGNQNTDMNESLLDENITIKNEAILNSPEYYEGIRKNDNETENKLVNKWIVNEDQIMLQTCKNVEDIPKSYINKNELIRNSDSSDIKNKKQFDNQTTSTKSSNECRQTDINKSLLDENITIKSEAIVNFPECYEGIRKNDDNKSESQQINKWTIDEDKIILQTCKRVEDIEVLLETIKRRIPQRSVFEIQERFTTLMTLLEQMVDVKQN